MRPARCRPVLLAERRITRDTRHSASVKRKLFAQTLTQERMSCNARSACIDISEPRACSTRRLASFFPHLPNPGDDLRQTLAMWPPTAQQGRWRVPGARCPVPPSFLVAERRITRDARHSASVKRKPFAKTLTQERMSTVEAVILLDLGYSWMFLSSEGGLPTQSIIDPKAGLARSSLGARSWGVTNIAMLLQRWHPHECSIGLWAQLGLWEHVDCSLRGEEPLWCFAFQHF